MPRYLTSLILLALTGVATFAPETLAQGPRTAVPPETPNVANLLSKRLRALREDIDVDLPDDRGVALGAIVDQAVQEVRQLQRATRAGAARADLYKLAVNMDRNLDQLVNAAGKLGPDGYYLRRAAAEINAQNEFLAGLLAPVTFSPRVFVLTEQLHRGLHALRDDIDVDLPDARGKALDEVADRSLGHLKQLHHGARFGTPVGNLRKHVAELNNNVNLIAESSKKIGSDGYYLNRSADQLLALGRELETLLNTP